MESKEIAQAIAEMMSSKKAKDVVMIDIAEKSSFADYFVIATGTSDRQLGALADDVEDKLLVVAKETTLASEEIKKLINFQEKYFESEIIR